MKNTIHVLLVVAMAISVTSALAAKSAMIPASHQSIIEVLEGYCLSNEADFSKMERLIQSEPFAKPLIQEMLQASNPMAEGTGKGWAIRRKPNVYMVAYMDHGGCSVAGDITDADSLVSSIRANYRIVPLATFDEGPQVIQMYRFAHGSLHEDGMLAINVAKFQVEGKKTFMLNYVPAVLANKIFNR